MILLFSIIINNFIVKTKAKVLLILKIVIDINYINISIKKLVE